MDLNQANLLLITFDQWRGDWTDPLKPVVRLPCLEKLSSKGLATRRCYTSSPQCVPARLSWLTGLSPSQMGVTRNCEVEITSDAPSIFKELQKQGWYTELIGKTHWTSHLRAQDLRIKEELIKSMGFNKVNEVAGPRALQIMKCELTDAWKDEGVFDAYLEDMKKRYINGRTADSWKVRPSILPYHLYPDIWIADKGVEAIRRMPTKQPWILWISFVGPHEPFDTPEIWKSRNHNIIPKAIQKSSWIEQLSMNCELRKTGLTWENKLSSRAIKECRDDYTNNLKLLDSQIDKLTEALRGRQDTKKTAIAITSDHGEMLGDHQMLYKGTFLESSIIVPFFYTPPARMQERRIVIKKPIGLTSMFTTMIKNLEYGGKLQPLCELASSQSYVTVEYAKEILVIKNKRKLCCNMNGRPLWATNLRQDPLEQKNQLSTNKELLETNDKWKNIYINAKKEIKKREHKDWIWKDLTSKNISN